MGSSAGLLIATGLFTAVSSLPEARFLAWGWRIPYLLSIVLVAVGLIIRLKIAETPAFERVKETGTEARMPIVDAVRNYPRSLLLVIGMRVAENACGTSSSFSCSLTSPKSWDCPTAQPTPGS
jgi:MHS family shikimate/dehydroshikimate transporter-like MFS transporter